MIDLHSHTTESDGTFTPAELISLAVELGLEALSITDHDTFSGYEKAAPIAREAGLDLVCGIELSTKITSPARQTVHLLGYFPAQGPSDGFTTWLKSMQESRRDRNRRLSARLAELNVNVSLEEVEAVGRNMAGRPHFARIMVEKGYVSHYREAFDRYLDEAAPGYVHRLEPDLEDGIKLVQDAGGITSLAHPIRLGRTKLRDEEELIASMVRSGLDAIEAYHSDHDEAATERYLNLAKKYGLLVTGGSDFHGANKPSVQLGTGPGTLAVPANLLAQLREEGARRRSTPSPIPAPQPE